MLFALSIQLCLYSVSWLLMGFAFGMARQAVISWSAAWAVLAAVTFWLSHPALAATPGTPEIINIAVVAAFVLILAGTAKVTQISVSRAVLLAPIAGAVVIDGLRIFFLNETVIFRFLLFAACIVLLLYAIAARQARSLRKIGFTRLAVLAWSPALVMASFVVLRAIVAILHPDASSAFTGRTFFDHAAVTLFFVALGAFNFSQASFVIGLMTQRMRELSHTDQLTQLANRRSLMHELEREDARYRRTGRSFTLVIFDIDHFKKVNDTYGHLVGDHVLKAISSSMIREIRTNDLLARYGGEEFLLLMPETEVEAAQLLAERIRKRIMLTPVHTERGDISVTVSGGIAGAFEPYTNIDSVIKGADDALYIAKTSGRNRIVTDGQFESLAATVLDRMASEVEPSKFEIQPPTPPAP